MRVCVLVCGCDAWKEGDRVWYYVFCNSMYLPFLWVSICVIRLSMGGGRGAAWGLWGFLEGLEYQSSVILLLTLHFQDLTMVECMLGSSVPWDVHSRGDLCIYSVLNACKKK